MHVFGRTDVILIKHNLDGRVIRSLFIYPPKDSQPICSMPRNPKLLPHLTNLAVVSCHIVLSPQDFAALTKATEVTLKLLLVTFNSDFRPLYRTLTALNTSPISASA